MICWQQEKRHFELQSQTYVRILNPIRIGEGDQFRQFINSKNKLQYQ